jgi:maltose alpha-D-glucosyltransferase/alpha-amylase
MLGEARFPPVRETPYFLSLGPYGFYWLRLHQAGTPRESYGIEGAPI